MGKVDLHDAIVMRNNGYTFEQIGKHFGVSRQNVSQLFNQKRLPRRRRNEIYAEVPYVGLHELFKNDPRLTAAKLSRIMYRGNGSINARSHENKIIGLCRGEAPLIPIYAIKRLIEYSGMTFEYLFKEREEP